MYRKYLYLLSLLTFLFTNISSAKCADQSKTLEKCLQCCTDTVVGQDSVKSSGIPVKELTSVCVTNTSGERTADLSSQNAKDIYRKYKIDPGVMELICANTSANSGTKDISPYKDCATTCGKKFSKKVKKNE